MNSTVEQKNIFVLVPSYNEGAVIGNTIAPLLEKKYTVVIIDDCSTDDTKQAVEGLPIIYLRHEINLGQGAALQTGIDYALEQGAAYAITFDADGQHNAEEIPALLHPIFNNEADIALGSRFQRSEDILKVPAVRRWLLKGAILINGIFTGLWLSDAHNGFRAMNIKALQKIKLRENRMAHASEILSQIKQYRLRYVEVPVGITYTNYSKNKGQHSLNSVNILIDLIIKKIFRYD